MRIVQLDQEINARHMVDACEREGKVKAYRLPASLKDEGDDVVLATLLPKGNPILSGDWDFAHDWPAFIPDLHPGIVIVGQDDDDPYFDTHVGQKIVADFKREFPTWNTASWENSIVQIQPTHITVWHCDSHSLVQDGDMLDRTSAGWQDQLGALLAANAARHLS